MDRFSAYLLVRRFLRRPESRNRALAVEVIMEELARGLGPLARPAPESWGVMGLLSQLDLEYGESNPEARGKASRDQALLEGLDQELAESLARTNAPGADLLANALLVADCLAVMALGRSDPGFSDATLAPSLARELELRRQTGDAEGDQLDGALSQLRLDSQEVASMAVLGLQRAAEDLR